MILSFLESSLDWISVHGLQREWQSNLWAQAEECATGWRREKGRDCCLGEATKLLFSELFCNLLSLYLHIHEKTFPFCRPHHVSLS